MVSRLDLPKPVQRLRARDQLGVVGAPWVGQADPGPSPATLRDLAVPFRWAGLSRRDKDLLGAFLESLDRRPDEFHTHVPVGRLPAVDDAAGDAFTRKQIESLWPRRIDAMMRFGREWWLVECKPDANHYVLGQLLCYWYWLRRDCPTINCRRLVLVTDTCDPEVLPVLERCGVSVVELPR